MDACIGLVVVLVAATLLTLGAGYLDIRAQRRFKRLTPAEREAEIKRAWRRNGL